MSLEVTTMIKKDNFGMALFFLLALCFFQTANAAPVHFNITGGSLLVTTNSGANFVTDVAGNYGAINQQYFVQNLVLNAQSGSGYSDSTLGMLDFKVNFTGSYSVYDINTSALVDTRKFTLNNFHETGDGHNGLSDGMLHADFTPFVVAGDGGVGEHRPPNGSWVNTPTATALNYVNPVGNNEMFLMVGADLGGVMIDGTATGSLNIVATPIPAAGWLFISALASFGIVGKRKKLIYRL